MSSAPFRGDIARQGCAPMRETPERITRDRLFAVTFASLAALYLLPLLLVGLLPSQDLPNHFAIVATLARRGPDWERWFENRLAFAPYAGFYLLCIPMAKLVGAEASGRAVLAAYVVGFPAAAVHLAATLDRRMVWPALLSFTLVYGDAYLVGFLPWLLALPLVLWGCAIALRLATTAERTLRRSLALAALSVAVWLLHPLSVLLLALAVAALAASFASDWRRATVAVLALAPSCLLVLASRDTTAGAGWLPLSFKLEYLARTPLFVADAADGRPWIWLAASVAGALFAALAARLLRRQRAAPVRRSLVWIVLLLLLVYLVLPFRLGPTIWLDLRMAAPLWLFVFLWLGPSIAALRAGRVAVVALCVIVGATALDLHWRFDREAGPLLAVIDAMQPDQRVLPIVLDGTSRVIEPLYTRLGMVRFYSPYAHFASHYHVRKGGISPLMTFHPSLPWIPLGIVPPAYHEHFSIADPFRGSRLLGALGELAPHFDYVLVRGGQLGARDALSALADQVAEAGDFTLWRVRGAPAEPVPLQRVP
jgi:hypothetical protein